MEFEHLKVAFRYGATAGLLTVALFLGLWFIDRTLILDTFVWWSSLGIYLYFMYAAAKRFDGEGMRPYQEVLRDSFGVFVIANAIFYLFYALLVTTIDPSLIELQKEMMEAAYRKSPDFDPDAPIREVSYSAGNTFFRYAYSLLGGFLLTLGTVVFARR